MEPAQTRSYLVVATRHGEDVSGDRPAHMPDDIVEFSEHRMRPRSARLAVLSPNYDMPILKRTNDSISMKLVYTKTVFNSKRIQTCEQLAMMLRGSPMHGAHATSRTQSLWASSFCSSTQFPLSSSLQCVFKCVVLITTKTYEWMQSRNHLLPYLDQVVAATGYELFDRLVGTRPIQGRDAVDRRSPADSITPNLKIIKML